MTIWERINNALSGLGIPVGNIRLFLASKEPLPDQYVTFQVITAVPERFVDDGEVVRSYLVQINCWSRFGFQSFPDVEVAMVAAGFSFQASRDMKFEDDSGHYGHSMDFIFEEDKE